MKSNTELCFGQCPIPTSRGQNRNYRGTQVKHRLASLRLLVRTEKTLSTRLVWTSLNMTADMIESSKAMLHRSRCLCVCVCCDVLCGCGRVCGAMCTSVGICCRGCGSADVDATSARAEQAEHNMAQQMRVRAGFQDPPSLSILFFTHLKGPRLQLVQCRPARPRCSRSSSGPGRWRVSRRVRGLPSAVPAAWRRRVLRHRASAATQGSHHSSTVLLPYCCSV